jgi:IMP cyclohydrolase
MTELARNFHQADAGQDALAANVYPGRVLIMGLGQDGSSAMQLYAIMGRSQGSRDRIFTQEGTAVRTIAPRKTPEEMAATAMSELIYYRALRTNDAGLHVVSNGAQTDPVFEAMQEGATFEEAVRTAPVVDGVDLSAYEPDGENSTPRITGAIDLRPEAVASFGLVVASRDRSKPAGEGDVEYRVRTANLADFTPGEAYGIQTYNGNGTPLPSFDQEPFAYPMGIDLVDTVHDFWDTLNAENRVAVVGRAIDLETGRSVGTMIINATA